MCVCVSTDEGILITHKFYGKGKAVPVPPQMMKEIQQKAFYTFPIESALTGSITAWYCNRTLLDGKALHGANRSVQSGQYDPP